VVIHEYKINKSTNPQNTNDDICNQAFWQCYINDYLSAISKIDENCIWKFVIVRAMVFWRVDSKWKVKIK
jgi:hypothetical protein